MTPPRLVLASVLLLSPLQAVAQQREVPLEFSGGTFLVPVVINDTITLKFTLDSGASDVAIPEDVVMTLIRAGTITEADLRSEKRYRLADGSMVTHPTFVIRSLRVGDVQLTNVMGSIAGSSGSLLLGQSFLSRLSSWSIDNRRQVLVFNTDLGRSASTSSYLPAYGQPAEGVTCADGRVQSLASGPPFCSGRGGIVGYHAASGVSAPAPGGSGKVLCRDGTFQGLASGPPFCSGRGGIIGFR